jgi:hypothetical protein
MKIKNPFTKENITILLLLVGLTANSIFIGYYIGADLKEEDNKYILTVILVPVEIRSIADLYFLNISVKLLYIEDSDYRIQVRFYNDELSIYTLNATMLKVELIIVELYYYFRIDNWFYTYASFDLNATYSFTLTAITFWHLVQIDVEEGGKKL